MQLDRHMAQRRSMLRRPDGRFSVADTDVHDVYAVGFGKVEAVTLDQFIETLLTSRSPTSTSCFGGP
jgi:hypothetical protein